MTIVSCVLVLAVVLVVSGLVFRRPPDGRRPNVPAEQRLPPSPLFGPVLGVLILALLVILGGAILPGIHWDALSAWLRGEL
jgi:hypothetical protein